MSSVCVCGCGCVGVIRGCVGVFFVLFFTNLSSAGMKVTFEGGLR